jgi:hypothetical protein
LPLDPMSYVRGTLLVLPILSYINLKIQCGLPQALKVDLVASLYSPYLRGCRYKIPPESITFEAYQRMSECREVLWG